MADTIRGSSAGSRLRWVGPPVVPQNERGKSPSGRQRHYGAVELPGVGQQVYVNDVVQVLPKHNSGNSEKERHRLSQVLSMWEDTFTGVFKFRARWLMYASDLPHDALSRLRAARRAFANENRSSSEGDAREGDGQSRDEIEGDEVFLTARMDDLEVRLMVRPVTLSVTPSPNTEIPTELQVKMGPRFSHTYDDSTGDFVPVEDTDPILKRARVRQSEAVAFASRAIQEHEAAKNGEPVKSSGWLLPKRRVFDRKGRGEIGGYHGRGHRVDSRSNTPAGSRIPEVDIPEVDMEGSNDSDLEEVPNSKDEEWKQGDDGDTTDTDNGISGSPTNISTVKDDFTPRKSPRKRRSLLSLENDVEANGDSFFSPLCSAPKLSSSSQRRPRALATKGARILPPRPRRLDMPPVLEPGEPVIVPDGEGDIHPAIAHRVETKQARSAGTRNAAGPRVKNSLALPRLSSAGSLISAARQPTVSGKRRRSCTPSTNTNTTVAKMGEGKEESVYPPRHITVGKEFQAEIPDLLSSEERKKPAAGTGARMVWRSIRDWDSHSRGMLAEYLHAAKEVVQAKQARPGVAVHVRLGGSYSGLDQDDNSIDSMDCTGSYAVWAVTADRDACGVVRVACSEMAQTEVPRSAVQRVQCEEEALAALVKARCVLDNAEPALSLLANNSSGPESVEQWTLTQVRTLEKALDDEFDPKRRLHGWARPGMAMDREDFIDLARVSKQVPGKTPAQVLGFYYRYLAAAEPLTDVVYGPKAAETRRQEEVLLDRETDKPPYSVGHSIHEGSHPASLRTGDVKTLDGSPRASPAVDGFCRGSSGTGSGLGGPELTSDSRIVRHSPLRPSRGPIMRASNTEAAKTNATHAAQAKAEIPSCPFTIRPNSRGTLSPNVAFPREDISSRAVDDIAPAPTTSGPQDQSVQGTCNNQEDGHRIRNETKPETSAAINEEVNREADDGSARHGLTQQRRILEHHSPESFKGLPPGAEVFEVQDSDDETHSHANTEARERTPPPVLDAKTPLPKAVVEAAAKHLSTLGPQGLKWVARQMRAPSGQVSARNAQLPPNRCVPTRSGAPISSDIERSKTGHATYTPYAVQMRDAGLNKGQRHAIWDRRLAPHSMTYATHVRRPDEQSGYGVGSGSSAPDVGVAPHGSNVQQAPEEARTDDMFGAMAPCWRLLERAKTYMDKDQLVYMRGLILTHVKKPMSRDQLLERAESCLHEQGHIFAAFVKMFDRIDQSPSVPLYPASKKRQTSPDSIPRQMMPYTSAHGSPSAVASRSKNIESARFEVKPHTFQGKKVIKHNTILPSAASGGGMDRGRSSPGCVFPHAHPTGAAIPGRGWWPPRVGGRDSGPSDFVQYPPSRGSPMSTSAGSGRGAPHLDSSRREYPVYDGGAAPRKVWPQQLQRQPPHQPPHRQLPQWRMDSSNASVAAAAAVAEAMKRGEARRGPTWGSNASR